MTNKNQKTIGDYYFPIFLLLVTITGYWDSLFRKIISIIFPILIIMFFLFRYKLTSKVKTTVFIIGLYIIVCIISSFLAYDKIDSFFFTFRIFIFFLLVSALYHWMNTYHRYQLVVKSIILSGTILSTSIIFSLFFGNVITELSGVVRAGGFFSNVNSAGFICYISTVFAFMQYLEKKKKSTLFLCLFFILGIIITGSRASMLAIVVTTIFYNLRYKLTKKTITLTIFGGITAAIIFYINKESILNVLRLNRGLAARDVLFNVGINIAKDHPFTGIGLGNLREIGSIYLEKEPIGDWIKKMLLDIGIQSSHNAFLETTVELGVFGLLFFVLTIMLIGRQYYKQIKLSTPEHKNFYFLIWGIFMGILIRSFFESNGIINRGWITIDLFFWIVYVIFLRSKQWKTNRIRE